MKWKALTAGLIVLGAWHGADASPITYREISLLVRMGEPSPNIVNDTARRKLLAPLSPQEEAALGAAGAAPSLLAELRNPALLAPPEAAAAYRASQAEVQSSRLFPTAEIAPLSPEPPRETSTSGPEVPVPELPFSIPKTFVGSPKFHTREGKISAGTASLAKLSGNGPIFLLTVRHLLGTAGGFRREVAAGEIPDFVTGITLNRLFAPPQDYRVQGVLVSADPKKRDDPLDDLAVFRVADGQSSDAVELAASVPPPGEPVWFIAHVRGGVPKGQTIHGACVAGIHREWLLARYENQGLIANGASGSPVLDREGKIVGVFSGETQRNGIKYALIIPVSLIRKQIP